MKRFMIIISVFILVFVAVFVLKSLTGPNKRDYKYLTEPRIIRKESVVSIIVPFDGDSNKVLKESFRKLFRKYYSLKGVPKGSQQPAPVARYEGLEGSDIENMPWKGFVALPIGDGVTVDEEEGIRVSVIDYGLVAEIVHFGPYDEETENIVKLKNFIKSEGYVITGLHEEEYIKGPGFIYVPPKKYITIIRYQIGNK